MRISIFTLLAASVLVGGTGCVHVGCQEMPLPLAIPIYAVAAPILFVRGDLSHAKNRVFDVTDLVGADLEKTKALAKEISRSVKESGGLTAPSAGRIRMSEKSSSAEADVERWLAARRASLRG